MRFLNSDFQNLAVQYVLCISPTWCGVNGTRDIRIPGVGRYLVSGVTMREQVIVKHFLSIP